MGQRVITKGKSIVGYCLLFCPKVKLEEVQITDDEQFR